MKTRPKVSCNIKVDPKKLKKIRALKNFDLNEALRDLIDSTLDLKACPCCKRKL